MFVGAPQQLGNGFRGPMCLRAPALGIVSQFLLQVIAKRCESRGRIGAPTFQLRKVLRAHLGRVIVRQGSSALLCRRRWRGRCLPRRRGTRKRMYPRRATLGALFLRKRVDLAASIRSGSLGKSHPIRRRRWQPPEVCRFIEGKTGYVHFTIGVDKGRVKYLAVCNTTIDLDFHWHIDREVDWGLKSTAMRVDDHSTGLEVKRTGRIQTANTQWKLSAHARAAPHDFDCRSRGRHNPGMGKQLHSEDEICSRIRWLNFTY